MPYTCIRSRTSRATLLGNDKPAPRPPVAGPSIELQVIPTRSFVALRGAHVASIARLLLHLKRKALAALLLQVLFIPPSGKVDRGGSFGRKTPRSTGIEKSC